jgi:hypothetical protein
MIDLDNDIDAQIERTGLSEEHYEEYVASIADSREHKIMLYNSEKCFLEWLQDQPDKEIKKALGKS